MSSRRVAVALSFLLTILPFTNCTLQAQSVTFQGLLTTPQSSYYYTGAAVDSAGNIYTVAGGTLIQKMTAATGAVTVFAGNGSGCAGQTDSIGDGCLATRVALTAIMSVTLDGSGNVYFTEYPGGWRRIRRVDAVTHIITTVAGTSGSVCAGAADSIGDGCPATSATISGPNGVAADAAGNIYYVDNDYKVVRAVNMQSATATILGVSIKPGYIATVAGIVNSNGYSGNNGPAISAQLNSPHGVAIDATGDLLVYDDATSVRVVCAATTGVFCAGRTVGNIYTVAGNGTGYGSSSGDGGPATSAQLCGYGVTGGVTNGLAVDSAGNLYISDNHCQRVRVVCAGTTGVCAGRVAGNIYTVAGNGVADFTGDNGPPPGQLNNPSDVAVDRLGNLYIADSNNRAIREVQFGAANLGPLKVGSSSPTYTLGFNIGAGLNIGSIAIVADGVASSEFPETAAANCPSGSILGPCTWQMTFNPPAPGLRRGAIVIYDQSSPANALYTYYFYGTGIGPAIAFGPGVQTKILSDLTETKAIAVDAAGNIYSLDYSNNRAVKLTPQGVETTVATGLNGPMGIAVDGAGNIFIAGGNSRVLKVPGNGAAASSFGTPTAWQSLYSGFRYGWSPVSVAVDGAGNVYVIDSSSNSLLKVTPDGSTAQGVSAIPSSIYVPNGVAVDAAGNVFVASGANTEGYIWKFPVDGSAVSTTHTPKPAFNVALDAAGDIYYAEGNNNVVKLPADGSAATTIGQFTDYACGAYSVAVDSAGNVYGGECQSVFKVDLSDPPTLAFANTNVGATSAAQDVTFINVGNATLQFSYTTPYGDFTLTGPDTTCITGEETLVAGSSCVFGIQFAPLTSGFQAGKVVLTNNSLNAGPGKQTILTSGNGAATTTAPTVTTAAIGAITQTTANGGGNVTSDGGATVTTRGVCWGVSTNPGITGNCTTDGTGTGMFNSSITGLTAGTPYHARAYATNSAGTSYGSDVGFTTAAAPVTASPAISLASGSYTGTQTVTLTDATTGAVIYYTTDGSTPTSASTLYTGPIFVAATSTIKAIAIAPGYLASSVASAIYTITLSCAAQPSGLVGWWQGENNGNDSIGPDPVTLSSAGATYAPGMVGKAFSFDGASGYAEKTYPDTSLSVGSQSWTISAWVRSSYAGPNSQTIVSRYACGWDCTSMNSAEYYLSLTSAGQAAFTVRDSTTGASEITSTGGANWRDGQFHLVTGVLDRSAEQLLLYVDGVLQANVNASTLGNIADPNSPLEIGRYFVQGWGSPGSYFSGLIDDVQIYNRALSASQVQSIYASASAGMCTTALSVSPTSRTFTAAVGGSAPAAQTISITNTGSGALNWTAAKTQTWLSLDSTTGTAPSTINASANPAGLTVGTYTDTVTVTAPGASGSPATVAITLTVNPVVPSVTTAAIGAITQTTASAGGNVVSDGGASVTARGVCWSTSTNPFAAASCTHDGTGAGTFTSSITGLTAGTSYHVWAYATNSVGTAYGADAPFTTATLIPQATLSPNPLAFPNTLAGTSATPLPITLSNPGTGALTISSISVTGTNASSFSQTNNCGTSLAAGSTCTITVTFTPATAASLSAAISVADNATGSPHTAVITGTGTAPLVPQAVLSPNPLTFPSTNVGTTATALPMTLSNPGNAPLAISNICVAGANASSFAQTNTCGASLAAAGTCTITVTFTPASAGSLAATISVTDGAAGSPHSAVITGTGSTATYVVNATTASASVQPGAMATFNIMVAPLGGSFNNMVTLTASGLPTGATYSFQPVAVMPGSAGAPTILSIQTPSGLARLNPESRRRNTLPMLALLAGVPLLGLAGRLRRLRGSHGRCMLLCLAALAFLPIVAISGCGGGYFGPPPQTYTVTVMGTSGSLQQSTTVTLTVQ